MHFKLVAIVCNHMVEASKRRTTLKKKPSRIYTEQIFWYYFNQSIVDVGVVARLNVEK